MIKIINNLKLIKAMIISLSSVFAVSFFHNDNLFIFNENFFISFCIYTILFYVALFGYEINKVVGILLFISTSFLSPNLYPSFKGELFPLTFVVFSLFLTYLFGIKFYEKWKTNL